MKKTLMDRWLSRLRGTLTPSPAASAAEGTISVVSPAAADPEVLELDLGAMLARDFADEYEIASRTTAAVLSKLAGSDLSPLARRSPSLAGYDWASYLRCSLCRVVRVQRALTAHLGAGGRVLDYGSYFGNFGLAIQAMGCRVDAIDSYRDYGTALAPWADLQREAGIVVHDFANAGYDLQRLRQHPYDAIVCAGVIEHIPHSPKLLLDTLTAALKPGGILILDTPNLGYLYKRLALLEGQSIFAPIAEQYYTEVPFEGHHREYTVPEVEWMLTAAGHEILSIETFNYSVFGQSHLTGEHLEYYRAMVADSSLRELMVSVSRRSNAVTTFTTGC